MPRFTNGKTPLHHLSNEGSESAFEAHLNNENDAAPFCQTDEDGKLQLD
jgi:hypothetical protein